MTASVPPSPVASAAPGAAPKRVIRIAVVSFLALLVLGGVAQVDDMFRHWVAAHHTDRLPLGVIWFGALGGSLASLTGIFWHHRVDWDDSFNPWHELRPWTGLVMGSIGAFMLLVSTELATLGTAAAASSVRAPVAFNPDIYYVAAFLAGFAEAPFRALVKRMTDAVFGPGTSKQTTSARPSD